MEPNPETVAPATSAPAAPATAPAAPVVPATAQPAPDPKPAPTTIRLASVAPLFREGGFQLSKAWSTYKLSELTEQQIETLSIRVGRWIRVYPTDVSTLEDLLADFAAYKAHKAAQIEAPATQPAPTATETAKAVDTKAAKAGKKV